MMVSPISAPDLANAVTGFATVLAGIVALLLTACTRRQPWRWVAVYTGIFVTGVPTVIYHGFGETYWPGLADIGTNLLLAWLLVAAVLGDYYRRSTRLWVIAIVALADLAYVAWRLAAGPGSRGLFAVSFGQFGGFKVGEALLILNSVLAVGLMYARQRRIPAPARRLWYLVTALFLTGALLATASNQQVDGRIVAYHALWHILGGFGFIVLWVFNYVRFEPQAEGRDPATGHPPAVQGEGREHA
jgi:hypothetical protein